MDIKREKISLSLINLKQEEHIEEAKNSENEFKQ